MRRGFIAIALAFCLAKPAPSAAQTSVFGSAGKWAIIKDGEKQCWMSTSSAQSIVSLARFKDGRFGIVFSIPRNRAEPDSAPMRITFVDVPFGKERSHFDKTFTKVVIGQSDTFYEAELSGSEALAFKESPWVFFSPLFIPGQPISNIAAAGSYLTHDSSADRMLEQCVDSL